MTNFVKPALLPAKEVRVIIASAVRSVLEGQANIQRAAEQALLHAEEHGDVSLLRDLVTSLNDRGDGKPHPYVTGVTNWIKANAPIIVKANGNWGLRPKDSPEYRPFTLEQAFAVPFWMMQAAGSNKLLNASDVIALIKSPGRSFAKACEDGRVNLGDADKARYAAAFEAAQTAFNRAVGLVAEAPKVNVATGNAAPPAVAAAPKAPRIKAVA